MAIVAVSTTVVSATGFKASAPKPDTNPINASTTAADAAAVAAALAVLVADGASPTQAHVTTANNAYTALAADLAGQPATQDVLLIYNTTTVVTRSMLRKALRRLEEFVESNGTLVP